MNALFLFILLIVLIFQPIYSILCHMCSHKNSKEASKLQLHDRLQSTPDYCEEKHVCQGKWCTQSLVGGNVSFGCSDHSPIEYIWEAKDIFSNCNAYYDVNGISHANCWCRNEDLCNSAVWADINLCYFICFIFVFLIGL